MPLVKRSHATQTKQSCLRFAKVAADLLCRMAPFDVLAPAELPDSVSENNSSGTLLLSRSASLTGRLFYALRGADCVVPEPVPVFAIGPRFNALTNEIIATIVTATTRMPRAHPNKPGSVDVRWGY
jgi:hypothetical protein